MDIPEKFTSLTFKFAIGIIGVALLVLLVYVAMVLFPGDASGQIVNLWQPVLAMIVVFVAVGLLAGAYSAFNLSNHSFALGLPKGSVRAILALSLIVIFTTVGMLLLSNNIINTDYEKVGSFQGLSQSEFDAYVKNLEPGLQVAPLPRKENDQLVFDGELYRIKASKDGLDIAKQILTALITALSVITGFYFGSRAARSESDSADSEIPGQQTPLDRATETMAGIEAMMGTIAAIEADLGSRIALLPDSEIKDIAANEHQEIVNQHEIAQEAIAQAKKLLSEIAKETDENKLAALEEDLKSAAETVERALLQAQAAMGSAEEILSTAKPEE